MILNTDVGKILYKINSPKDYKEFKCLNQAHTWGYSFYGNWGLDYKDAMGYAQLSNKCASSTRTIECYCGDSYKEINCLLRNFQSDSKFSKTMELADILSIVLCSAPRIPENIVVYRSVCDEFIYELIRNNKNGKPTEEKAFMSTSLFPDKCNVGDSHNASNNLLKIYLDKGKIGVYVNAVVKRTEEEILLCPGMCLGLIKEPYLGEKLNKVIYECKLV